mgnify:CR=1 FL=1
MTIKNASFNHDELTLLETITRESLDAFISESSKATGSEYLARCVDQIKVYKSLHDKLIHLTNPTQIRRIK